MSDERHNPDFIAAAAAGVLSEKLGGRVDLSAGETFVTGGSVVVRCRVTGREASGADLPPSVIVKKVREDEFEYKPDSPDTPNPAHWLFNDWAAAEFLGGVASEVPLGPKLYAGSRRFGLVVLEDLGAGEAPTTSEALFGEDFGLAEQTLVEHISLIARLHAATVGGGPEYRRIRLGLGALPAPERLYQDPWSDARNEPVAPGEVEAAIRLYRETFENLGVRPAAGADEEIERATAAVEENPGRFLAFCKGDQNMAGDYIRQNGIPRLFDFGSGGFRHALIEGMPARFTWGCMMRIPARLKRRLDEVYRAEFTRRHPSVTDEAFGRAMMEVGARWHIFHVVHRLPDALSGDRQRGVTTLRQQTIAWLAAFAELYEEAGAGGRMRALGQSALRMLARLGEIWPAETADLPYYPAFRKRGE